MENAYDLAELGKRLKDSGLPLLETEAEQVYEVLKQWLIDSADISMSPFDNIVFHFMSSVDTLVLPQIDKIDGEPG